MVCSLTKYTSKRPYHWLTKYTDKERAVHHNCYFNTKLSPWRSHRAKSSFTMAVISCAAIM